MAPHATLVLVLIMGRERDKYDSEHGCQIYSFIYISFTIELLPTVFDRSDEKTYPDQPKEKKTMTMTNTLRERKKTIAMTNMLREDI